MKLADKQHHFIEHLYNVKKDILKPEMDALHMELHDIQFLTKEGYILTSHLGLHDCTCKISPKGQAYYENYLTDIEEQKYQRGIDKTTIELAKDANEIARQANEIAKTANKKSKRANIISVVSIIVSILATALSILLPLLLKR